MSNNQEFESKRRFTSRDSRHEYIFPLNFLCTFSSLEQGRTELKKFALDLERKLHHNVPVLLPQVHVVLEDVADQLPVAKSARARSPQWQLVVTECFEESVKSLLQVLRYNDPEVLSVGVDVVAEGSA